MSIYKKVYRLTVSDLEKYPVWIFLAEEENGRDETFVKPVTDLKVVDPSDGIFILKSEFETNDGKHLTGYCYAHESQDLSYVQPTIITKGKHISFWHGMNKPDKEDTLITYKNLGGSRNLFPIKFNSEATVRGKSFGGTIEGLMYLTDDDQIKFVS